MRNQSQTKTIASVLLVLSIGVGSYFCLSHFFNGDSRDTNGSTDGKREEPIDSEIAVDPEVDLGNIFSDAEITNPSATEMAESMGMTMKFDDPAELVNQVMQQMSKVDTERGVQDLAEILGNGDANTEQLVELKRLFDEKRIKLRNENAIELLGEVKAGKMSRWTLHLDDDSKIQLQTTRQKDGTWKIDEVKLPLSNVDENGKQLTKEEVLERDKLIESRDSLIFSSNFLKELVGQNFEQARSMVNNETITDAKIAGLCILFEDGAYRLNEAKPLQAVRVTNEMSAFYVNVDAKEGGAAAQFSITTLRDNIDSPWLINEINLDRLLDNYAKRVAGGDIYYTPLVKKPNGGDMLVIYFDFDSDELADRTQKQLNIVVNLLKLDESKKIRLSGHTDSRGSDEYNQGLSKKRAFAVKEYLIEKGITPDQIVTEAHGFSKPIRQEKEDDNTNAQRANRRTEVYLDF